MRVDTHPSAAGGEETHRPTDARRAFARRIECDGGGYSAGAAERAREGGADESSGRERKGDPPR